MCYCRACARTLCNPKQPPEALVWSSALPLPEDSVAITTTGMLDPPASSPAAPPAHPLHQANFTWCRLLIAPASSARMPCASGMHQTGCQRSCPGEASHDIAEDVGPPWHGRSCHGLRQLEVRGMAEWGAHAVTWPAADVAPRSRRAACLPPRPASRASPVLPLHRLHQARLLPRADCLHRCCWCCWFRPGWGPSWGPVDARS